MRKQHSTISSNAKFNKRKKNAKNKTKEKEGKERRKEDFKLFIRLPILSY